MKLRPWQARRIRAVLAPALGYLTKLVRRMEVTGFAPDDRLFLMARAAQMAMQDLLTELHYRSCESGVGREKGPDPH